MKKVSTAIPDLSQIEDRDYQGYYWLSNQDKPVVISSAVELKAFESNGTPTNPFILEANLFCHSSKKSIAIKHVDNRYLINEFDLSVLSKEEKVEQAYLANKELGTPKAVFTEIWLPQTDALCEGLEVLTKKALVFTGFKGD